MTINNDNIKKELSGLNNSKALEIESVFAPMVDMLKNFEAEYEVIINLEQSEEKCKKAKVLRNQISKVRIEADEVRKTNKEEYLLAGNAIQGVYNILKFAVVEKEENLKDIELYYEKLKLKEIEQKQINRMMELASYGIVCELNNLGEMNETFWNTFLIGSKATHDAEKEKIRLEKIAIKEKEIADKKEREKIRIENERLKREIDAKGKIQKEKDRIALVENNKIKIENERIKKEMEKNRIDAEALKKQNEKILAEKTSNEQQIVSGAQASMPDSEKLKFLSELLLKKVGSLKEYGSKNAMYAASNTLKTESVAQAKEEAKNEN